MKISKVTISAFRAFNKKEDATFDFTVDGTKPADFISVYAPNGFGKTSLYDAIEWGITDSIDRFNRNAADHSKSSIEERKRDKNKLFLRNNAADPKQEAFVEVITDASRFYRSVPNTVYDFRKKGKNLYFKNVILSQDAIDSFLREENPEQRYQKFLDSFKDLKKLDTALNNIIKLQIANQENISDNEEEIARLEAEQLNLNFQGDKKILTAINDEIRKLIALGEKIQVIERNFSSQTELKILDTRLTARMFDLESFLSVTKGHLDELKALFSGEEDDTKKPGIAGYYQRREAMKVMQEEFDKLGELLENTMLLQERLALYNKQQKDIADTSSHHAYLQQYVPKMPTFKEFLQRIATFQRDTVTANINIREIQISQQEKRAQEIETSDKIVNANQSLAKIKEEIILYPSRLAMLNANREAIRNIQNDLKSFNENRGLLAVQRNKVEEDILTNTRFLNLFANDIQELLAEQRLEEWHGAFQKIITKETEQAEIDLEIHRVGIQLEKSNVLNRQLAELISLGTEILSREQTSSCPLCRTDFDTYSALSERINGNDVLGEHQKELLEKRNKLQSDAQILREEILKERDVFIAFLQDFGDKLLQRLDRLRSEDQEFDARLKFLNENLDKLREDLDKNIVPRMQEDPEGYLEEISREESRLLLLQSDLEVARTGIRTDLENLAAKLGAESSKVEYNISQTNEVNSNEAYIEVRNFIDNNLFVSEDPSAELDAEVSRLEKRLKMLTEQHRELSGFISDLQHKLGQVGNKADLETQRNGLKVRLEEQQRLTLPYEQEVESLYKLKLRELSSDQAISELEKVRLSLESAETNARNHLMIFKKISGMKVDTFAYLESARTAGEIAQFRKENADLGKVNGILDQERISLTKFISSEVQSFFNSDLINQIYFKIEPHPEYIAIEFECSFSPVAKPRLELWVIDKNGGKSIPVLYFSSAQINILSLSVFLARALITKDNEGKAVNCIFIDDPIQSMDSINVLSFVDLFRSLVVSYGKQIIISTHEENFHNLLQKKVPEKLFNSKYLSLETFGKVASA